MNNYVMMQGVLYITGVEIMRVERIGPADTEPRYSGYLVTGSDVEKARHPIRISTEERADEFIALWRQKQPDQIYGAEAMIEGKLMSVLGGQSYVLVKWLRFVGTADLTLRRGNYTQEQIRRVGVELNRRQANGR